MVIALCLLKAFIMDTLVLQTKRHTNLFCTVAHNMLCVNSFLSDNSKQDADTKAEHSKPIVEIFILFLGSGHSPIWKNVDGWKYHYRCATVLYLLSILSQYFNTTIDCGISSPAHCRYVLYGLNATDKHFILHLMTTVQLPGCKCFDAQMTVHTATKNTNKSLALKFKNNLSYE